MKHKKVLLDINKCLDAIYASSLEVFSTDIVHQRKMSDLLKKVDKLRVTISIKKKQGLLFSRDKLLEYTKDNSIIDDAGNVLFFKTFEEIINDLGGGSKASLSRLFEELNRRGSIYYARFHELKNNAAVRNVYVFKKCDRQNIYSINSVIYMKRTEIEGESDRWSRGKIRKK